MASGPIRILLVDDHSIVRQGLRALLDREKDLQVVGEGASGLGVVELVRELHPDVVVLDLMIPDVNGLEITRSLCRARAGIRIIILSMYSNEAYVANALRNGARGYVLKGSGAGELLSAIRLVMTGKRYLSSSLSEKTIEEYLARSSDTSMDLYEKLTTREREILSLAAHGMTNTEIGGRLFISPRTVEVHRANLMRKLCLRSHSELLRYALGRGILLPDQDGPS